MTHVEGRIDPVADAETVETELMLADLESLERRIVPIEKRAKTGEKEALLPYQLMTKAVTLLREGRPARYAELTPEERERYDKAVAEAVERCSQMPFMDSMGGAVAGRTFRVNFVDERNRK